MKSYIVPTSLLGLAIACILSMTFRPGDQQGKKADQRKDMITAGRWQIMSLPVKSEPCPMEDQIAISRNPLLQSKQINFFIP
jgi:hypothetical protein